MTCDNCNNNSCGCDPCSHPAKYGCDFDIQANPYDASIWNVTINGATTRVRIPKIAETDTKLSTSYTAAALTYSAEKHADTITGAQLGSLIKFADLRDVDATNADPFDLVVFHPYCDVCGDGCTPKNARWTRYHIPDEDTNVLEADDDGYYHVLTLSDCGGIKGARVVKGYDDSEIRCMLDNMMRAIKPFEGDGKMVDVQSGGSTPGFEGGMNPNTGEFYIAWKDWDGAQVAHGMVTGRLNATSSFDYSTGKVTYTITSIYYDKVTYAIDTNTSHGSMTTTIWGCFPGSYDLSASHATLTSEGLKIFERTTQVAPGNDYTVNLGITYTGSFSITLNPNGGQSNWIDVMRLYNDWIGDDDGIVKVRYRNPLDWETC